MTDKFVQVYEEIADRHNAAYDGFKRTYEKENPMPSRPRVEHDSWFVLFALVLMVIASVVVSGSRTIEEFGGGAVGIAAFAMLEIGIVTYAFFRTKTDMDKQRVSDVRKMAQRGLALAFVVAVAANIHAVLKSRGIIISENINTIINILVAISAPTLAFISGDVMALELLRNRQRQREADDKHAGNMIIWNDSLTEAWKRQRANWGVKISVESEPIRLPADNGRADTDKPLLSALSAADGQRTDSGHGYGVGYQRTTDARTRVTAYLAENPEAISMNVRDLAQLIGVGKTTVSDVIKDMKRSGNDV